MINNFFLVNSPFQLISAIEAVHNFKCENNVLVIRLSSNERNNNQIKELIEKYNFWEKVYVIPYMYHEIIGFIKYIATIKKLKKYRQAKKIFLGEYRSFEMHLVYNNLKHEELYLLDDGTITLKIQKEILSNISEYCLEKGLKLILKKILYRSYKLCWREIKIPHLFTIFNLHPVTEKQLIINNEFKLIKENLSNKTEVSNEVYFIGAPSVEDKIITEQYFFKTLNKIKDYYKKHQISKIIYIPHRRESQNKLDKIHNVLSSKIVRFEKPLEFALLEQEKLPLICCSFFSTALFTINNIFENIEINSFKIPNEKIASKDKSRIKIFYENMIENNITVIENF